MSFPEVGGDPTAKPGGAEQYHVAAICPDVYAVSYLSPAGHTLTVLLDYKTMKLFGFASNEKSLSVQNGTFELVGAAPR